MTKITPEVMANYFSCEGQLHYCSLITSLVDDFAISQKILSTKNVTPTLFYFMRIAIDEQVCNWLTDSKGRLKEANFLQALNLLITEDIFIVGKKSVLASFLLEHGRLSAYSNTRNVQTAFCRPIDPNIEHRLRLFYRTYFVDGI